MFKGQEMPMREYRATEIDTAFFSGTCSSCNFLKKHNVSEAGSVSILEAKKRLTWLTL
jgi:hypothetical protein